MGTLTDRTTVKCSGCGWGDCPGHEIEVTDHNTSGHIDVRIDGEKLLEAMDVDLWHKVVAFVEDVRSRH